ncbi:acetyltransferase [Halalkaliarchaeum desulfuricum]|uniref:Acetyltransferase n=1 Tax=Halalkaliarchaeum desulfuricum TaxID=2055893 RepID=A0A343TK48_9EURY|nr:DUF5816 domain-containing protein [Halalkaliarchaeum desulfuricum]AUX09470.1 acetyltransferase [Halalkaliarchaeum desulfuricum]
MSSKHEPTDGESTTAEAPHCGVCEHVYFQDDWERTPFCAEWNKETSIRVGEVCSAFSLQDETTIVGTAPADTDVDVEIDWEELTTGTDAPFFAAYRDDEKYGWMCGNCRTLEVAIDTMGQFVCNDCGNKHSPTEWDPSYL